MPSLKAIRKRITSVKNTRKITRAMKLVSTAKLRRAQEALIAARPYSTALARVVSELSAVVGADAHKLFDERPLAKAAIVVVTSDRGQAGAFNANVVKAVERFAASELSGATEVSLRIIGRKGNQYFARRRAMVTSFDAAPTGATALSLARETANRVIDDFTSGKVDRVFVVYNEFKSAISQVTRVKQLLPVVAEKVTAIAPAGAHAAAAADAQADFVYEPSKQELLDRLAPLYVQIQLYRASLESIAAFFAAQMTAMENATKNAGEMISRLTLSYNRARQAAITKELLEIIGGAEALKG
ncbi:MAG: ATP synthase F1 subunit gamma [Deltaproteobacteria bacterium]|nr:MAG: ATP synthase F1 subunit gamma [Deltaproteobacteria bacterium]TMQ18815.1 MAG: ATP synthase F1 subunit gamma [Deltaproteobacteria bacterium]